MPMTIKEIGVNLSSAAQRYQIKQIYSNLTTKSEKN